jgi:hypothetical protein
MKTFYNFIDCRNGCGTFAEWDNSTNAWVCQKCDLHHGTPDAPLEVQEGSMKLYPICPTCGKALFCRKGTYHVRCQPKEGEDVHDEA